MRVRSYCFLVSMVLFTVTFVSIKTRMDARDEIAGAPRAHAQNTPVVSVPGLRAQITPAQSAPRENSPAVAEGIANPSAVDTHEPSMLAEIRKWVDQHSVLNRDAESEFLELFSNIEVDPQIVAYAEELATSVDPGKRRLGFLLLQRASALTPAVFEILVQSLTTEQNPAVLSAAIRALGHAVPPSDETAAVVMPLRYLVEHADTTVRAASVEMLARWDTPATAEVAVYEALMDPAREVRLAAVTAVTDSGLNSERLKSALLNVARNPNESLAVKANALTTLENDFSLTDDEAASYQKSRQALATLPKGSDFAP